MSFQRNNTYYRDSDEVQHLLDNFRELIHGYNENMRYHHRALETYQQNINQSISLLQLIFNRINNSRVYPTNHREPRSTTPTRNTHTHTHNLETDLTSLIYLFMTPPSQVRNTENRFLTPTQIENALEMIMYNSETIEERHCPISLDDFIENEEICRIRGCGHIFRRQPLMRWLETHIGCPVCRYDLHDFSNNNNVSNTSPHTVTDTESNNIPNINPSSPSSNHSTASLRNSLETLNRFISPSESSSEILQNTTFLPRFRNDSSNIYTLQLPLEIISNHLEDRILANRLLNNSQLGSREDSIPNFNDISERNIDATETSRRDEENTRQISQMIANVLRNQLSTIDISNNI